MLYIWPWTAPEFAPDRLISSMITDASVRPSPPPPNSSGISAVAPVSRGGRVSFAAVQVVPERAGAEAGPFRLRLASGAVLEWASAPGIEVLGALIERVETPR